MLLSAYRSGSSGAMRRAMTYTEADFDRLSWHDCHIWGVGLRVGEPDEGDWTSDLVLDLDFTGGGSA